MEKAACDTVFPINNDYCTLSSVIQTEFSHKHERFLGGDQKINLGLGACTRPDE